MRKKRNRIEYGNLMGVSELELRQAHKDAKALLIKLKELQLVLDKKNKLL